MVEIPRLIGEGRSVSVFDSPAVSAGFDDVTMVRHSIKQSGSHFLITKDRGPFTEGEIGGDNDRGIVDTDARANER